MTWWRGGEHGVVLLEALLGAGGGAVGLGQGHNAVRTLQV